MLKKLAALPVLAFIVLVEPLQAIAQQTAPQQPPTPPQGYYGPGPWHMWNGGYGWRGFWMFPLMMLFLVIVCVAFFAVARRSCAHGMHAWGGPANVMGRPRGDWGDPTHSALQILNERFARGEIQKEEYTEKKAALMSGWRA
jgi:putative membrane protein